MKVKYFIYLFAVVLVTIAMNLKDRRNQDLNLVANIEAFSAANDESGGFKPYHKLADLTIVVYVDEIEKTRYLVPCCKSDSSPFSGCSAPQDCPK